MKTVGSLYTSSQGDHTEQGHEERRLPRSGRSDDEVELVGSKGEITLNLQHEPAPGRGARSVGKAVPGEGRVPEPNEIAWRM